MAARKCSKFHSNQVGSVHSKITLARWRLHDIVLKKRFSPPRPLAFFSKNGKNFVAISRARCTLWKPGIFWASKRRKNKQIEKSRSPLSPPVWLQFENENGKKNYREKLLFHLQSSFSETRTRMAALAKQCTARPCLYFSAIPRHEPYLSRHDPILCRGFNFLSNYKK